MIAALHRLRRDRRGVTIVEFAMVAPVMIVLMMGLGDILYQAYAQSILDGAVQKAARDSALQGAPEKLAEIDGRVVTLLKPIVNNPQQQCGSGSATGATWCTTRKNYDSFSRIKAEPFTDTNNNGVRNAGECFDDVNGNGAWDADPGLEGQGFADDVTVYVFTLKYPPLFPTASLIGGSGMQTITTKTILKNQPYASQSTTTVATLCT